MKWQVIVLSRTCYETPEGEKRRVQPHRHRFIARAVRGRRSAQDKTVQLKLSSWVPPAHPLNPALQAWAEDIEKESGGTIKSTLFPSEQLGKAFDHYDMARDGIADFAYVNPGYQPGRFPIIAAGELPFLVANAKGGSGARCVVSPVRGEEMKDVHFCFAFVLDPGTFHCAPRRSCCPRTSRA